jgi:hypothetical protein
MDEREAKAAWAWKGEAEQSWSPGLEEAVTAPKSRFERLKP